MADQIGLCTQAWKVLSTLWEKEDYEAIGEWTYNITEQLAKQILFYDGKELKELTASAKFWNGPQNHYRGEYLVDLVLSIEEPQRKDWWNYFRGLVLAMESELSDASPGGRWEDFIKLADVRAKMRVFVGAFEEKENPDAVDRWTAEVCTFLSNHMNRQVNDEYLLALYFKGSDGQGKRRDLVLHGRHIIVSEDMQAKVVHEWSSK